MCSTRTLSSRVWNVVTAIRPNHSLLNCLATRGWSRLRGSGLRFTNHLIRLFVYHSSQVVRTCVLLDYYSLMDFFCDAVAILDCIVPTTYFGMQISMSIP